MIDFRTNPSHTSSCECRVSLAIAGTIAASHNSIIQAWYQRVSFLAIHQSHISKTHRLLLLHKHGELFSLRITFGE